MGVLVASALVVMNQATVELQALKKARQHEAALAKARSTPKARKRKAPRKAPPQQRPRRPD